MHAATHPVLTFGRVEASRISLRDTEVVQRPRPIGVGGRPTPGGRGPAGLIDADLVEQTLTACLTLLAQTAAESGQSERAYRLHGAVCALRGQVDAAIRPHGLAAERPVARSIGQAARPRMPVAANPLTDRQLEVAVLITRGMTNREIADELVIAERTADTHVQNILNKLGLGSRAQIAAWAVEQGVATARPAGWD